MKMRHFTHDLYTEKELSRWDNLNSQTSFHTLLDTLNHFLPLPVVYMVKGSRNIHFWIYQAKGGSIVHPMVYRSI